MSLEKFERASAGWRRPPGRCRFRDRWRTHTCDVNVRSRMRCARLDRGLHCLLQWTHQRTRNFESCGIIEGTLAVERSQKAEMRKKPAAFPKDDGRRRIVQAITRGARVQRRVPGASPGGSS
jgi:hypothetical protein